MGPLGRNEVRAIFLAPFSSARRGSGLKTFAKILPAMLVKLGVNLIPSIMGEADDQQAS